MSRAHIVWVTPQGDRIIDQFARILSEGTGWTLSDQPDPRAAINISMLYIDLMQRFPDWDKTGWVSYFSHFETGTPYKEMFWHSADEKVKLRLLSARQYLPKVGEPAMVFPIPLDHGTFKIMEVPKKSKYLGVSGRVDASGRKGEKTLRELARDLGSSAEIVSWGNEWGVKSLGNGENMKEIARFYNGLQAYLCTSTIEGVPMPPLSALACGVPVIIPRGVGMLDDLPEMDGIFRYDNYETLRQACEDALHFKTTPADRETLRSVTLGYTPENFCLDIRVAVELVAPVMDGTPVYYPVTFPSNKQRGVVYVAYGTPSRKCFNAAARSWKKYFPEIPVGLISDKPIGIEDVFIEFPDNDIGGRLAKVCMYDLAPQDWDQVMYLDADTEIIARETFMFDVIEDGWDFCICKNPVRFHVAIHMRRPDNEDECNETFKLIGTDEVIQLYGGALSFQRNQRTKAFFDRWVAEWKRYGKRDQGALLRALWANPLRIYVLGNEWNTTPRYYPIDQAAWLLHYHTSARRHQGIVKGRLDSSEAWDLVEKFGLDPKEQVTW